MDFDGRIEAYRGEMTDFLQQLVRIRSVEALGEGGYPFGKGAHECLEKSLALGASLGMRTCNVDNMAGWCEIGEGAEMVAILAHLDVVPEGDGWTVPPYGGVVKDGKLYGRGAIDNKGPAVASLFALRAIAESGVKLNRRIRVLLGCNEETGCAGIRHYVEAGGETPVMGFTPDGNYPIINGEKGLTTATYRHALSQGGKRAILSIRGGVAANVVPDKASALLRYPQEACAGVCARSFENVTIGTVPGGLKLDAVGVTAHGSMPEKGRNAIAYLLLALGELGLEGESGAFVRFMNEKIGLQTGAQNLGAYREDELSGGTTLCFGVIDADETHADITLNLRYPVTADGAEVIAAYRSAMREGGFTELKWHQKDSIYMPPEAELIKTLSRVYEEKTGLKAELLSIGGGTYAKEVPNLVAFGPVFPGDPEVEHQANEFISLDRLEQNAKIIAAAMYELAK